MVAQRLIDTARGLSRSLSALASVKITDRRFFDQLLCQIIQGNPEVYGAWCVWEPDALDGLDRKFRGFQGHDQTGRFIPFWTRSGDSLEVQPNTNYSVEGVGDYYQKPRFTGQELTMRRSEYFSVSGEKWIFSTHVVPFFSADRFIGAAGIDVLPQNVEWETDKPAEASLTPRESEVLKWISQGKSNPEIALILGISVHTTKRHVEKVLAKLGVENRLAASLAVKVFA